MEGELGQELLKHAVARLDDDAGNGRLEHAIPTRMSKKVRRWQAWHYLIPIFATFWLLFTIILIASGFFFLVAALATLALLSSLVIGLAWAFQNNI